MPDAHRPPQPQSTPPAPRGWQRRLGKPLRGKSLSAKSKPWLRLLNDADQAEGFEYHNPRLSIFYPQEGL